MSLESYSVRDFTSLEIYRPIDGAEEFLAKVGHFALNIYGNTEEAVVTQPVDETFEREGETIALEEVIGVGFPRAKVARPEELEVVILERKIPKQMNFIRSFHWASSRLIARAEKVALPIRKGNDKTVKYRTSGIYESLDKIGYRFGIFDQDNVDIECTGVQGDVPVAFMGASVLSLTLNPAKASSRMLVEQSNRCLEGLGIHSKKATFPASRMPISVPFATLPKDSTERQAQEFVERVTELLPLKLVMHGVQSRIQS